MSRGTDRRGRLEFDTLDSRHRRWALTPSTAATYIRGRPPLNRRITWVERRSCASFRLASPSRRHPLSRQIRRRAGAGRFGARPLHQLDSRDRRSRAPDAPGRAGRAGRHRVRRAAARRHPAVRPAESPQARRSDLARRAERALSRFRSIMSGAAYHSALKTDVADRAADARPALSRVGARSGGHRRHARESHLRSGPGSRRAAFSLDRVRRSTDAAARHARRGVAHTGHAGRCIRAKPSCCSATCAT